MNRLPRWIAAPATAQDWHDAYLEDLERRGIVKPPEEEPDPHFLDKHPPTPCSVDVVKILIEQVDGREVILAFLGAGDTVGEMSLVDSAGRSANVMTMERCTLLWMDRATFQDLLRNVPEFAQNLVKLLAGRLRMANEQIQSLSSLDVAGRLARQILAFAERYGRPLDGGIQIPLRLTQSDLAELVGASRERVNQVMVEFRNQNLLTVDSTHRIHVQKQQELARFCR
jgi:CRP/FNR family cyclic AMP-dependent transcriptional regulator